MGTNNIWSDNIQGVMTLYLSRQWDTSVSVTMIVRGTKR